MTIAEKIARAKADYDEVFEAGKKSVLSVLDFSDIESTTYRVTVPSGADDFARVNKIGGMTHKTRNLIPFPYQYQGELTLNGVTWNFTENGITASGTQETSASVNLYTFSSPITLNGTYTASLNKALPSNSSLFLSFDDNLGNVDLLKLGNTVSTTTINNRKCIAIRLWVSAGATFNGATFYPMLNEGTTALPYEPYFEGLRSAEVTELRSEIGNLFNYDKINDAFKGTGDNEGKIVIDNVSFYVNLYTGLKGGSAKVPYEYWHKLMWLTKGTYYCYFDIDFYGENVSEDDKDLQARSIINGEDIWCGEEGQSILSGGTFRMTADGYCYLSRQLNKKCIISNLMITRTPRTEYVPYKPEIVSVPEAVRSLDGYGLGKNADEYNYIDFGNKIFKQDYAKVRLPSNKGTFNADSKWYYISKTELGISPLSREILCNLLPSADITANSTISGIYMSASQMNYVLIRKTEFTTEAEYKQWLTDNEVYIIERLAEPIETDISSYLTDEYIEVEGGGTITAVNEYGYDVPTNISYLIDTQGG